jgi:hypothetical protein
VGSLRRDEKRSEELPRYQGPARASTDRLGSRARVILNSARAQGGVTLGREQGEPRQILLLLA